MAPVKNNDNGKICYMGCLHDGSPDVEDVINVQCLLCSHIAHNDCVGVDEFTSVWTCFTCRMLPETVNALHAKLDHIMAQNAQLTNLVLQQQGLIQNLQLHQAQTHAAVQIHDNELKSAVDKVLKNEAKDEEDDDEDEDADPEGVLLIGDSLLRDITKTDNTLVINSIRGATLSDMKKKLKTFNPKKRRYEKLYLVIGTNDTATKRTADKIAREYKELLTIAKRLAPSVNISSIYLVLMQKQTK